SARFPGNASETAEAAHEPHNQTVQGRPVVLCRQRARGLLLRTGHDRAPRQRGVAASSDLVPRRKRRSTSEGLTQELLKPVLCGAATHARVAKAYLSLKCQWRRQSRE